MNSSELLSNRDTDRDHDDAFEMRTPGQSVFQAPPVSINEPLPTDVPPPPNLASLPPQILHSGTVETLIGQNDDLMSRLKVNIRRNAVLEQQVLEHQRVSDDLARANASLLAQMQIMLEKERLAKEKHSALENRNADEQQEIELTKERLLAAEERKSELKAMLRAESVFRRRVMRWVRPLVTRLKSELNKERALTQHLVHQLEIKDATLSDLKARHAEVVRESQGLERSFARDRGQLVAQYEAQMKDTDAELQRARAELKLLRDKATRLDLLTAKNAELENREISLTRKSHELTARLNEFEAAQQASDRLSLQFESLQKMWMESQKKIESLKTQNESLNLLNQELVSRLTPQVATATPLGSSESLEKGSIDKVERLMAQIQSSMVSSMSNEGANLHKLDFVKDDL